MPDACHPPPFREAILGSIFVREEARAAKCLSGSPHSVTLTPSPWMCTGPQAADANLSLLVRHQTHRKESPLTVSLPWGPVAPGCEGWHLAGCWGGDSGHQVPAEREAGGLQGDSSPRSSRNRTLPRGMSRGACLPQSKELWAGVSTLPVGLTGECVRVPRSQLAEAAVTNTTDRIVSHRHCLQAGRWSLKSGTGGLFLPRPLSWAYRWLSTPCPHGVLLCLPVSWSPPPLNQAPVLWDQDPPPAATVRSFSLHHLCKDRISKHGPIPRYGVQGSNIHIEGTHRAPPIF